jgi:hypothetical protein
MLMGGFPGEQKIQDSRSRRRFVPPVGWEVHQGGFRSPANNLEIIELMMNRVLMVSPML